MKKVMFIVLGLIMISIPIIAQDGETPVPKDWSWIWMAVTGVLTVVTGLFSTVATKWKGKAGQLAKFGSESVDVLQAGTSLANIVIQAGQDNVFTPEEKLKIKDAAQKWKDEKVEAVAAWRVLLSKDDPS